MILDGLIARNRYLTPEEQTKYHPQRIANKPDGKDAAAKGNTAELPETAKPVQPRTNQSKQGPAGKTGAAVPPRQTINSDNKKPPNQSTAPPTSQNGTGNEIDEALRLWNGNPDSKRAVAEYMAAHGRERETAAWLAREYGAEDDRTPLCLNIPGVEGETVLSWPQVQRRIAILMRENRFFLPEELEDKLPAIPEKNVKKTPSESEPYKPKMTESELDTLKTPEPETDKLKMSEPEPEQSVQSKKITVPVPTVGNYHITDEHLGEGKPKDRFRANMDAIRTLKTIESEGRFATREEQEILSRYVGWGGLSDAFDSTKRAWKKEYQELLDALSPKEYEAARASILDAYFTSPAICRAVWEAVKNMGFTVGNVLEPSCGVGNFFGTIPQELSGSRLYGVELDGISARIAKQLYPDANITVAGFETTSRRDFFDLAIGNVPFGQQRVNDKAYNKLGFSIHNYFFAKALDQVRPGGVVAFITSHHTMDAKSTDVRKYLSQRAELLGAVRLPDNAFKSNAGTDVVTDIIFLQKRDHPIEKEQDWVHLARSRNGYPINCYFAKHPEMILGTQSSKSTPYGERVFTVKPFKDRNLPDLLREALRNIRGTIQSEELPELGETEALSNVIPSDPDVKNFSYTLVEGEPYYRQNSVMIRAELSAAAKERLRGMVELRDCVHRLIDLQMDESVPDSAIRQEQETLNRLYNTFTERFGLISSQTNRKIFSDDSSYYLICSLEVLDEDGKMERKADIFTKRTIKQRRTVSHVDTAAEALAVSIGERACVNLGFMASLMGDGTPENRADIIPQIVQSLRGVIYKDPATGPFDYAQGGDHWAQGWQTADEYLSGNVRRKLREAKTAAEQFPEFQANVEALEQAQPKDLDATEIEVRLGTTWIDRKYFEQFMRETLRTPRYYWNDIRVEYSPMTADWNITNKSWTGKDDVTACSTYGTERANGYRLLEDALNLRDTRIYDTVQDADGKEKYVLNVKETTLAAQKQNLLREEFKNWIWKDPERRDKLVRQYNEEMNSTRPREYDGSHLVFSGMNPEITLREHQKNAIAHILYGGNTLLAHEVGAGKTFEMAAAAMEAKRLGLCNKPIFVVPNHLVDQWAAEFLRLYPAANILVTTKKDFKKENRKKFCARIATGEYDAVIIAQSQFEKIPVSVQRQERMLKQQIREIADGIRELESKSSSSDGARFSIRRMEALKKSLEAQLEKLQAAEKKDDVVTFEQLGVDMMFVDESDTYKNLFLFTKMRNVAGLSTANAQKSFDMFMKCRYLDEITGNRGAIFASGTCVSNSISELYSLHRYLQYDRLQEMGMGHFDCWASRFGETVTALELAPEGTGYRARTRFSRFFNLPELINFFKEVADIQTADQLHLPVPQVEYHVCSCKPTQIQKEMVEDLSARASMVHAGLVNPSQDNMLKITSDGRKLGLDPRIIDPSVPDEQGTKVNQCVANILRIWREGNAEKLTQLVFCDISTPKKRKGTGLPGETGFNVYDDIRRKLIAGGMPLEQIAFVHDADTEVKKRDLFAKVRAGQVRVLMGSTAMMGAGTNVQTRAVALHDLDCPWRPRDLTQRKGRIERQGNQNKTVHVYRYVTEATFDAYLWQTVEAKQRFISQIMTSKSPVRTCEDVDEAALSYAEIKAICAGDPRIREKMDLDVEVSRLKLMKADHQSRQFRLEDQVLKYFPEQIAQEQDTIRKLKADMETLSANPIPAEGFIGLEIFDQTYTDREKAGEALLKAIEENAGVVPTKIGNYRGFAIYTYMDALWNCPILRLDGQSAYRIEAGSDARGNLTRIDNELARLPDRLTAATRQLGNLRRQRKAARAEIGKDFPYEKELSEKTERLALLNLQLDLDSKKETPPGEDGGRRGQKRPRRAWSWDAGKESVKKRTKKRSMAR